MRLRMFSIMVAVALATAGGPASAQLDLLQGDPVVAAVSKDDMAQLRLLINRGVSLERAAGDGRRALAIAASLGAVEAARLLIEARANPNGPDNFGNMPLHWATTGGSVEIVDLLLKGGARIDQENRQGITPLMQAVREGRADMVQRLLAAGAQARKADFSGRTALDWAREGRNQRIVSLVEQASRQ